MTPASLVTSGASWALAGAAEEQEGGGEGNRLETFHRAHRVARRCLRWRKSVIGAKPGPGDPVPSVALLDVAARRRVPQGVGDVRQPERAALGDVLGAGRAPAEGRRAARTRSNRGGAPGRSYRAPWTGAPPSCRRPSVPSDRRHMWSATAGVARARRPRASDSSRPHAARALPACRLRPRSRAAVRADSRSSATRPDLLRPRLQEARRSALRPRARAR